MYKLIALTFLLSLSGFCSLISASKYTVEIVNKVHIPKTKKAAEEAAEKLAKYKGIEKLSKRQQAKVEELLKTIKIYKFWLDYKETVKTISTSHSPTQRQIKYHKLKSYEKEYKDLTGKEFPNPFVLAWQRVSKDNKKFATEYHKQDPKK